MTLNMDKALAIRIEAAYARIVMEYTRALEKLRPDEGVALLEIAGGIASYRGSDRETNQAFNIAMDNPVTGEEMEKIESFFQSRGLPTKIGVCPFSDRSLLDLVRERDYRLLSFQNTLAQSLINTSPADDLPDEMTLRRADPDDREEIIEIYSVSFADKGVDRETWSVFADIIFMLDGIEAWVGEWKGRAVGMGIAKTTDGIAFMTGSATLPEARNRGIHTALIEKRREIAYNTGCDLAVTATGPGSASQRNFEGLGFSVAYTQTVLISGRPLQAKKSG